MVVFDYNLGNIKWLRKKITILQASNKGKLPREEQESEMGHLNESFYGYSHLNTIGVSVLPDFCEQKISRSTFLKPDKMKFCKSPNLVEKQ